MNEERIYLGVMEAVFFDLDGERWFKIVPVLGLSLNFVVHTPLRRLRVLKAEENELVIRSSIFTIKVEFLETVKVEVEKVKVKPRIFHYLPWGIYGGEISKKQKFQLLAGLQGEH